MKQIYVLTILTYFFINYVFGQTDPYKWNRLPSDAEINIAKQNLVNKLTKSISVNSDLVDNQNVKLSSVVKFHDKNKAGKRAPQDISRALVWVEIRGIGGTSIQEYNLFQNKQDGTFGFAKVANGGRNSAKEQYNAFIDNVNSSENTGIALGFAPQLAGSNSSSNRRSSSNDDDNDEAYTTEEDNDDSGLWTIVIGALSIAIIAGVIKRRKKRNTKKDTKDKDKKEQADYILQLNRDSFNLALDKPQQLQVKVWKVTEKGKSIVNAPIEIQSSEKTLKVIPSSSSGTLNCQLSLKKTPSSSPFNISVTAIAGGKSIQKTVKISTGQQLIVQTAPDNIRSLRPNIEQNITCFAKIIDGAGKNIDELTKKIQFDPSQSDWIDLSIEPYFDEGWAAIYIGASDPDGDYDVTHPPKSVTLLVKMEDVVKGTPILQENVVIKLLDCKLETDLEQVTFPATKEQSEIVFKAYIEACEDLKDWQFEAVYMKDHETKDLKPLTNITVEAVSEKQVNITLTGPIIMPDEGEQFIRKQLLISAKQEDEKALERHIYVTVSKEGIFIENGVNKKNEVKIIANGNIEKELIFSLYKYNPDTDEIEVDKIGLENLKFELLSTEKKELNIASVLEPTFEYRTMINSIPHASYLFTVAEEIPGSGETISLKYRVTAPIGKETENFKSFSQDIIVQVETLNLRKKIPSWKEAYNDCKYVINTYVPEGQSREKLNKILEERKILLDAEGLVELRKQIWRIAYNLILAEGAEGYKDVAIWANRITVTLEWIEWAGDLAFNSVSSFYMSRFGAAGAAGGVAINMAKQGMAEAINFYVYEDLPIEVFIDRQYQKIIPLLMNVAKGRLISVENIELVVKKNKAVAYAIFIACEYAYNLYQTKSMIQAAKETARQIRDELIIRKITGHLHKNAMKYKINNTDVETVIKDVEKYVKGTKENKYVDKAKVLEIMKDPAKVRTLKNHAPDWLKRAFDKTRTKIYKEHDAKLIKHIAEKYHLKPSDIEIDDFRTPGSADGKYNLNTDRDYRVLRTVKTNSGKLVKIEIHRDRWLNLSYEEFGKLTKKPSTVSAKDWAELHQQRGTDRYDAEASADYSDHFYDPEIGEIIKTKPNILKAENGEGTLYNAESLGKMYENKVKNALQPGAVPEAYAQAQKGVHTLKKVIKGYKKMDLETPKISDNLQDAMKVIEKMNTDVRTTSKQITEARTKLEKLGYKGVGDVIKDVSNKFKDLSKHDTHLSFKRIYN